MDDRTVKPFKIIKQISHGSLKMKQFETLIKQLVLLGVNPNESSRFNWKITMVFFIFGMNILLSVISIFTMENIYYVEIICVLTAFVEMSICLLAIVLQLQQTKLFTIIGSIEKLINKSKPSLFAYNVEFSIFFKQNKKF